MLHVDPADGGPPAVYGAPQGRPPEDLGAAVAGALQRPLDYPPLPRSTTPGDRVVLAIDHGLPQAARVVAATVGCLVDAGVDPDGISVLRTPADLDEHVEDPCRLLPAALRRRIDLLTHDPRDRRQLAYLAANAAGEPILLNRAIHDADLVLPVGCLHAETAAGYYGIHGTVFPAFSDQRTLARFRSLGTLAGGGARKRELIAEVDEVAWLLGINFTIQLVPASGAAVLHVVAGQSDAVRRRGRELYRAAWDCPVRRRASLVVASIEGEADQQTWQNFGRALATALDLVDEGGSVAVCCDLASSPGPAIRRMAAANSRQAALRRIRKERPDDALPAAQLARALEHTKVYLLSRLEASLVEDLDMIYLAAPEELSRLARQHASCILLSNAPHAIVSVP